MTAGGGVAISTKPDLEPKSSAVFSPCLWTFKNYSILFASDIFCGNSPKLMGKAGWDFSDVLDLIPSMGNALKYQL